MTALLGVAAKEPRISGVEQRFPTGGEHVESVLVDVVAENGARWFKVTGTT